jgi:hypothetical protein
LETIIRSHGMTEYLFKYKNSIGNMTDQQLLEAFASAEKQLRGSAFKYSNLAYFPSQFEEMKGWPEEAKEFARKASKEIQGQHSKDKLLRISAERTMLDYVAPKRAAGKESIMLQYEKKVAAAELAVATLFRRAPSVEAPYAAREYVAGKPAIKVKPSTKLGKLVVNCDEIDNADVYVYCLYNEQLQRAWLVGYATKADLKKKRGNRTIDPENCPWAKLSYYVSPEEIKPMKNLLQHYGVSEVPEGVLLEQYPEASSVPLPSKINVELLTPGDSTDKVDLDELLGLKKEPKKEAPKASPPPFDEPKKADDPKGLAQGEPQSEEFAF